MKPTLFLALAGICAVVWLAPFAPLGAQSAANSSEELAPLAAQIVDQQKVIDENQIAIEKSLALIQEDLRQAKIYVSRAGQGRAKK